MQAKNVQKNNRHRCHQQHQKVATTDNNTAANQNPILTPQPCIITDSLAVGH